MGGRHALLVLIQNARFHGKELAHHIDVGIATSPVERSVHVFVTRSCRDLKARNKLVDAGGAAGAGSQMNGLEVPPLSNTEPQWVPERDFVLLDGQSEMGTRGAEDAHYAGKVVADCNAEGGKHFLLHRDVARVCGCEQGLDAVNLSSLRRGKQIIACTTATT